MGEQTICLDFTDFIDYNEGMTSFLLRPHCQPSYSNLNYQTIKELQLFTSNMNLLFRTDFKE